MRIITDAAGIPVSKELLGQLVEKADGVPLYLEELTKLVVEQGLIPQANGRHDPSHPPPLLTVPAMLADSLMARLDRLTDAKGIAQLGAAIGRQFSHELLEALSTTTVGANPRALRSSLTRLLHAGLIFVEDGPQGVMYTFKHALIQDAAYASLLRTTRLDYHRHIARALAEQFSATGEASPELLAHHYTEAGMVAEAVPRWLDAGQRALHASAYVEAIAHLDDGPRPAPGSPARGRASRPGVRLRP